MSNRLEYYKRWRLKNKEKRREYRRLYALDNHDKILEAQREWYKKNRNYIINRNLAYAKENADLVRKRKKKWCKLNKKRISDSNHVLYMKTKLKRKLYVKTWRKTDVGKLSHNVSNMKRRANLKTLSVDVVKLVYEENIKKYKVLTCELCFKKIGSATWSLDHFCPVSRRDEYVGDINERKNLGIAHKTCNSSKLQLTREEWFSKTLKEC